MIHTFNRFSCLSAKSVWLSQWCGTDANYCDACCQNGQCTSGALSPPSTSPKLSSPPPPTPPTGFNNSVNHGEDSRLIGYIGSWQACPTTGQYNTYSHMVVAFAVSYTYHWFAGGSHRHKNVVAGSILCRHDWGMSAKCCRAEMSATFPAKVWFIVNYLCVVFLQQYLAGTLGLEPRWMDLESIILPIRWSTHMTYKLVPQERLELSHLSVLASKTSVSADSTIGAYINWSE